MGFKTEAKCDYCGKLIGAWEDEASAKEPPFTVSTFGTTLIGCCSKCGAQLIGKAVAEGLADSAVQEFSVYVKKGPP
jgi:hypothetical protein